MSTSGPASTCDLCDAHKHALGTSLVVLDAGYLDLGGVPRFSGAVATVRCFEDNSLVREAVETRGQGRVLVVDGGGSTKKALVGGNIAALAAKNGWAGIVVRGAVRDKAELAACAIGIRALALVPLPTEKRGLGERDVVLELDGGRIAPGDMLHADADGIVVLKSNAGD